MRSIVRIAALAVVCSFGSAAFAATPTDISAAKRGSGNAFAAKKAECKREANAKKFGVHMIQRNRWIKDCIAGTRT